MGEVGAVSEHVKLSLFLSLFLCYLSACRELALRVVNQTGAGFHERLNVYHAAGLIQEAASPLG